MRRKHTYSLAFLAVLAAALAGFTLARRNLGPIELPKLDAVAQVQAILGDVDINALIPRRTPEARPTVDLAVTPATASAEPIVEPAATSTPSVDQLAAAPTELAVPGAETPAPADLEGGEATSTPEATPTPPAPTPTAAPLDAGFLFVAAGPVRNDSVDCPGASIRGVVRDAAGTPLRSVRLWRYDQWGNEQVVESKSGDADAGQYDFPLGDTPNVHYVQIVDSAGVIISPVIEVQHRQGDSPEAACHWLDWVGR